MNFDTAPLKVSQHTEKYVNDQLKDREAQLQSCGSSDALGITIQTPCHNMSLGLKPDVTPFYPHQNNTASHHRTSQQPHVVTDVHTHVPPTSVHQDASPSHAEFKNEHTISVSQYRPQRYDDQHLTSHPRPQNNGSSQINDFIRYLARRELVATGLLQFNDKSQNYRAWKRPFLTAISDLRLSASEEMDLLLKWLGKESAEHVEQIRAIHIHRQNEAPLIIPGLHHIAAC